MLGALPAAVGSLADTVEAGAAAAEAIRTTDTHAKTSVVEGAGYVVGGMAKGAGMLAPGLATMLCVLTTDAAVACAERARPAPCARPPRTPSTGSTRTAACPPTTP